MTFKEVENLKTGRKTYYIDGRRTSHRKYDYESSYLDGYNSSVSYVENGRRYHCFANDKKGE